MTTVNFRSNNFNVTTRNYFSGSVASVLAATPYQGNLDSKHKLWNIVFTPHSSSVGMLLHLNGGLLSSFHLYVKVRSRPSCICGILYFTFNVIYVINTVTKRWIIVWNNHNLYTRTWNKTTVIVSVRLSWESTGWSRPHTNKGANRR